MGPRIFGCIKNCIARDGLDRDLYVRVPYDKDPNIPPIGFKIIGVANTEPRTFFFGPVYQKITDEKEALGTT